MSQPDGSFGGVVVSGISLSKIHDRLKGLDMGRDGSITLFRDDGIVLVRQPYLERQINQDLSDTPNVQRFIRESSGTFDGTAALDGVRRLYTFKRIDGLPLFLTVSKGVDEFLAPWRQKALIQSGLTLLLCAAVMGLTYLFQRELRRRTSAEAKLVQLASTDDLTGLANRRTFREFFERERRQAIRTGSWLSLLYVDADFFKAYNDHYGHGKGDDLLCAIASTLKEHVERPRDLAARYGGEEFTVLLPDTDPSGARMIAEEIREAIMLMGIEHKRNSHGLATVSIGIASARPSLSTPADTLLEAADNALYQAKAAGRNCVRLHHTTLAVVHPVEAKAE
ncbi:sensor domain-containing diguanylate cyclase [Microvirga guangxiensis]|uniref:sensor domain-containing diguanylate cyclase n=1 Tax=Microvirga guangxiensis TaxID=549386 RepID=UPI000B83CA19|nr:diguanylate cyclase [Microvirga guangxiensis]